jgi:hypothetical protein
MLLQPNNNKFGLYKEKTGLKLLPPQDGLICNLDMEKVVGTTVYDRSGNGYNATTSNVATESGIKGLNKSTYYNATSSYSIISNFFQSTDIKHSYEIWFKVFTGWASTTRILAAYGGANKGIILTYNSNSTLEIFSHGGQVTTTETFNDTNWHHIVVTENNGQLNITIDNKYTYSVSHTFTAFNDNQELRLGASNANTLNWKGNIVSFRVWRNKVLSAKEIQYLYNNGYGIK